MASDTFAQALALAALNASDSKAEVFTVTYASTPYASIKAAYDAGKILQLNKPSDKYIIPLNYYSYDTVPSQTFTFAYALINESTSSVGVYEATVTSDDYWYTDTVYLSSTSANPSTTSAVLSSLMVGGTSYKISDTELAARVTAIEANGVRYKGVVNYYDQLPTTGVKIGDLYTIKYQGTSSAGGTASWGAEYVCAKIENSVAYYEEIGLATQATIVGENLVLGQAVGTVAGTSIIF